MHYFCFNNCIFLTLSYDLIFPQSVMLTINNTYVTYGTQRIEYLLFSIVSSDTLPGTFEDQINIKKKQLTDNL